MLLEPALFSHVEIRDGIETLAHLLDAPLTYEAAADLFCLDLYKEFDVAALAAMGRAK